MQVGVVPFSRQLQHLRLRAGLSQEQLAERAGLSQATIGALEQGRRQPHPHTAAALAEALALNDAERAALLDLVRGVTAEATATDAGVPPTIAAVPAGRVVRVPAATTLLIGREGEVAKVGALLHPSTATTRLLTLVGPGGMGKTRLALAVANSLASVYSDGVVFVDLAPVRDHRLVAESIARALGLRGGGGRGTREQLQEHLAEKQMLLVLDNFEQLLGAAPLVAELVALCPSMVLLTTSRAVLRLRAERRFQVGPLSTPADDLASPEDIAVSPAVRLFVERAQAVAPEFMLDSKNAPAVAAVCRRLDGMPLAIELAAARADLLQPQALLQRLEQRLPLLTAGAIDVPERQQTLQATLAWSHDLLDADTQVLFRRLAVFAGGWTLEAAEAVCTDAALSAEAAFDGSQVLVDSSLLQARQPDEAGDQVRFGMLDTVREYATRELIASGELESIRAAHAAFYSRLVEPAAAARTAAPWTEGQSPELTDAALERLEVELDNLEAALNWWATGRRPAEGLRLAIALSPLWSRGGHYRVGRRWLEAMLELTDGTTPAAAASAQPAPVSPRAEQALALAQAGSLASLQGDTEQARAFYRRSAAAWRALDHVPGLAIALANLGLAEWLAGDAAEATALLEEALARSRAANLPHTVAISLRNLGLIARSQGKYARAEELFGEAAAQAMPPGWFGAYSLARSLSCLGRVASLQEDLPRAGALLRQAFEVIRQAHTRGQALADCLDWQAALETQRGDLHRAVRLFGSADAHWRTSGAQRYAPDEAAYARDLASVRAALDERLFSAGWAEGAAMPPEQAIAYALQEIDAVRCNQPDPTVRR